MPEIISAPAFTGEEFTGILIGIATSIGVTLILTFLLLNRFENKEEEKKYKRGTIASR